MRSEAWLFVLHGNVHDMLLYDGKLVSVADFLAEYVLDKKETVLRYNVSTGCRAIKKPAKPVLESKWLDELLAQRAPEPVLGALEEILHRQRNVGVVIDYGEMIAPAGDASFLSQSDRTAVVTLQRWSLSDGIERNDNVILVVTESVNELHPKIVANPRVAVVRIPMPGRPERREVIRKVNSNLEDTWIDRFADVTAGLKSIQLESILRPAPEGEEDPQARLRFIIGLVGDEVRARKLAALTQGMSREEVAELVGAGKTAGADADKDRDRDQLTEVLGLIARRKREIIERECFGLIEFVASKHDFSVVGGMEDIKNELGAIARNIRDGYTARVPMGILFTGPMGTGKTFVAEAFVKESGLTGIKLKSFRSKWVGATEANLDRILDVIQAIGNVIVIIDEGDRSFGSGGGEGESDGGTGSRVIARLKEFMADTANRGRVLFVMMTNRPDKLDVDIKRAGRFDRKIPFLYPQTAEQVELVLGAQIRKHKIRTEVEFPRDRDALSARLVGYSNADIEALLLLAFNYATAGDHSADPPVTVADLERAVADYLPSRDVEMIEYMELLAVFEASNRRMLPPKYAELSIEELENRLDRLRIECANRR